MQKTEAFTELRGRYFGCINFVETVLADALSVHTLFILCAFAQESKAGENESAAATSADPAASGGATGGAAEEARTDHSSWNGGPSRNLTVQKTETFAELCGRVC